MERLIAINPVQVDLMIPECRGATVQSGICMGDIQRELLGHISGHFSRKFVQVMQVCPQKTKRDELDREAQTIEGTAALGDVLAIKIIQIKILGQLGWTRTADVMTIGLIM